MVRQLRAPLRRRVRGEGIRASTCAAMIDMLQERYDVGRRTVADEGTEPPAPRTSRNREQAAFDW